LWWYSVGSGDAGIAFRSLPSRGALAVIPYIRLKLFLNITAINILSICNRRKIDSFSPKSYHSQLESRENRESLVFSASNNAKFWALPSYPVVQGRDPTRLNCTLLKDPSSSKPVLTTWSLLLKHLNNICKAKLQQSPHLSDYPAFLSRCSANQIDCRNSKKNLDSLIAGSRLVLWWWRRLPTA